MITTRFEKIKSVIALIPVVDISICRKCIWLSVKWLIYRFVIFIEKGER